MGKKKTSAAAAPTVQTKLAYRDLDPLEQGGRVARGGFDFQDHVAACKCLDMLLADGPAEVWCEAEDDIVLVWVTAGDECFEFVQVKSTDIGQAWTVARLCEPTGGGNGPGRCIVEKSLAHDRANEKCRFRIVTSWNPDATLLPLTAEFGLPARMANASGIAAAAQAIETKIAGRTSPNNHGILFWAEATVWEVRASAQDLKNENLLKLERVLEVAAILLDSEQRQRLYDRLYLKVQDASLACGRTEKDAKRIKRAPLLAWLLAQANAILHPAPAGTSANLERKLADALVPAPSVEAAKEQRQWYLREVRQPKYLSLDGRDLAEAEALARLHRLKVQFDAGGFPDDGLQFLSRCHQELLALRDSLAVDPKPADSFMLGYLYEVMNRCRHDLRRASA